MRELISALRSFVRQSLSSLFPSSAKPSLPRDASLPLHQLETKTSQLIYRRKDPQLRSWEDYFDRRQKQRQGMEQVQSRLNPEAGEFLALDDTETPLQQSARITQSSVPRKKKKKGKQLKHAVQQQVSDEARILRPDGHTDRKEQPSPESGGVPEPSQLYLNSALLPPSTLPSPRPILIVMDLNGTILHRPPNSTNKAAFVERPHANRFMQYCLDTFHVAIWSSARPKNVKNMVKKLLTADQVERCLLVWSREELGLSSEDYDKRVQCYKRLEKVWNDPRVKEVKPEGRADEEWSGWDQSNTVLVDDSFEKGRSEPYNILALPEFANTALERQHVLPQVHDYLNELAWQDDVSRYMRSRPFKLDPAYKLPLSKV